MIEVWKKIPNYEDYEVSNLGNVKSIKRNIILSPSKSKNGYLNITLHKDGNKKLIGIHRLVAQSFLSNFTETLEVNHKDENKSNNVVSNLEMCSRLYNVHYGTGINRHGQTKRNNNIRKVYQYDLEGNLIKEWRNATEASLALNIRACNIIVCCRGYYTKNNKRYPVKSSYGYIWKYE